MVSRGMTVLVGLGFVAFVACGCLGLYAETAESEGVPASVYKALAADERAYCDQFLGDFKKGCRETFRAHLIWREIEVSPVQNGMLVELHNIVGECGSAGCTLYIFVQRPDGKFVQVLGTQGDVGDLTNVTVSKTITNDHYDIAKTWRGGKTHTIYKWNGLRYSAAETPD
jgi:hypothetical protein